MVRSTGVEVKKKEGGKGQHEVQRVKEESKRGGREMGLERPKRAQRLVQLSFSTLEAREKGI